MFSKIAIKLFLCVRSIGRVLCVKTYSKISSVSVSRIILVEIDGGVITFPAWFTPGMTNDINTNKT